MASHTLPRRTGKAVALTVAVAALAAAAGCAGVAPVSQPASYFLTVQDGRAGLNDGASFVRDAPDTLAIVELSAGRLRTVHQIAMPTSLVGPPSSIAIAPGGRVALVSAATRRDPVDGKKVVAFDLVSVVALDPTGTSAPRVVGEVRTGAGASGISINPVGTLALVANRVEGSISVLAIAGEQVRVVGKVPLNDKAGPAHVAFAPGGRHALVTRDGDNRISLLSIEGQAVKLEPRDLYAGLRPYGLDISADGAWAVVGNLGAGQGDSDTISLLDLKAQPPRVVDTVTVGQTPEAVFLSPDGREVGVTVIGGSNKPKSSPFNGAASYRLFSIEGGRLRPAAELMGGQWLQGHAFSPDGQAMLVQDASARQLRLYHRAGSALTDTGERLSFDGAPSAIKFWR